MSALLDNPIWRKHLSPYAAELAPFTAEAAREMTAVIHTRVPEVGEHPVLAAATLASAEENVALVLAMMRDGTPVEQLTVPAAAIAQAREYAVAGAEITLLHRSYRVGHELFWNMFVEPLRNRIEDRDELAAAVALATEFTFHYVDAISTYVMEIFSQERERWVRSAAAVRAETVRAVLNGRVIDVEAVGRRLGYDLARAHVGFLVWSDPTEQDVLGLLEERAARLAAALGARTSLLVPLGRHTIAGWISTPNAPRLRGALDLRHGSTGVHAAVGSVASGIDGFRLSHTQAVQTRRVLALADHPATGHVEFYDDVVLVALATQESQLAGAFVASELRTLADGSASSERLAETLAVYLATGSSPARTAKQLGVHENTVANRIAKAEKLLGHPIEQRRIELAVALRMRAAVRTLS